MIIGNCPVCGAEMRVGTDMTNADRIRAMTDEELAEFIGDDAMHDICPNNCQDDLDRPCKVCALEWLKQVATE